MSRPWRLTRQAEASLVDLARWTLSTFGPRQAASYRDDLIDRCDAIAEGTAMSQGCRQLIDPDLPEDLRFARSGQHFIVFVEYPDSVTILDFLHARTDLSRRLADMADRRAGRAY